MKNRGFEEDLAMLIIRHIAGTEAEELAGVLGLPAEHVNRLTRLSLGDAGRLAKLGHHFMRLNQLFDCGRLMQSLGYLGNEQCRKNATESLLRLGAPRWLMRNLYGMDRRSYAEERKRLGIRSKGGCPKLLSEREECEGRALWEKYGELPLDQRLIRITEEGKMELSRLVHFYAGEYPGVLGRRGTDCAPAGSKHREMHVVEDKRRRRQDNVWYLNAKPRRFARKHRNSRHG